MGIEPNRIAGVIATPRNATKLFRNLTQAKFFVNGEYLGELSGDALEIAPDQNTVEIITGDGPQGTKPSDIVVTGSVLTLTGALAASGVNIQSLSALSDSVFDKNDGTTDAAYFGASLFVPKKKVPVKIVAIDESIQSYSRRPQDIINLYEVDFTVEKIFSANSGEAQTLAFTGMVYQKIFTDGERYADGPGAAAGYVGPANIARVPEMVWPDKIPPFLDGVSIASATTMVFTLSRSAKLAAGKTMADITIRDSNGNNLTPSPTSTSGAPTTTTASATWTNTYAAGTFDSDSSYNIVIPAGTLISVNDYDSPNIEQKRRTTNAI